MTYMSIFTPFQQLGQSGELTLENIYIHSLINNKKLFIKYEVAQKVEAYTPY